MNWEMPWEQTITNKNTKSGLYNLILRERIDLELMQ